jgi:hypothetical protein
MSVDNGGNAASNMIRMKLFIVFFTKAKRPTESSPAVAAYSIRDSFSQERMTYIQPEKAFVVHLGDFHIRKFKDTIIYAIPAWAF